MEDWSRGRKKGEKQAKIIQLEESCWNDLFSYERVIWIYINSQLYVYNYGLWCALDFTGWVEIHKNHNIIGDNLI